jgi:peptidoglycan/LPS O-acetylase OafA/YrhL
MLLAFLGLSWRQLPRWAVYLGRVSFGLYVFHGVAHDLSFYIFPKTGDFHGSMFILRFFTAFGLTVAMATVSYRYIESPFLKLKKRHTIIESQPMLEHLARIGVPEAVSRA